MADTPDTQPSCASCAKTDSDPNINLKRCAKCQTTHYCSRECQKADWKVHKKVCAKNAADTAASGTSSSNSPAKGLSGSIDKPFHRLENKTWLHDRPEQDVYKLLIDTYRFRMDDDYSLEGKVSTDSVYGGARNGLAGFRRFLRLAESRPGLLPPWWSAQKASECVAVGMQESGWSSLSCAIEKSDVQEHYDDSKFPMQLRMFGEQVYGRGPAGQSGSAMRQVMMAMESGGLEGMVATHLDIGAMSHGT
ncbi:putative MYND domain protein [Glonium stellatum]|uniref:Putative MYND domain protein n=1 Tax=Glonium stellatum TaxID=574774 RepID=A0A8E2EWY2_9PEZI|nr:putative MYND domain protein [Glonium stellatum]